MKKLGLITVWGISVALLVSAMVVASSAYTDVKQRQVEYDYIADALAVPSLKIDMVRWQPSKDPLARVVTEADRETVGTAITEAWNAHAAAQHVGQTAVLADYFTDTALNRAVQSAEMAHASDTRMAVLAVSAEPVFHHLDGTLMQLMVEMQVARYSINDDGSLGLFRLTRETALTTLVEKTSRWEILSHERIDAEPIRLPPSPDTNAIGAMAGINYYPAKTPWRDFWPSYERNIIEQDFNLIADLDANTIRIFLPHDFGLNDNELSNAALAETPFHFDSLKYDSPIKTAASSDARDNRNPTVAEHQFAKLEHLLDAAHAKGLKVIPTLFDLKQDYDLAGWSNDHHKLSRLAPLLADHPAVSYVDIKNEPDLDFQHHGRARVEAWLRSMTMTFKNLAPDVPVTIGWASHRDALTIANILDVLTYHDYADPSLSAQRLDDILARSTDKPVMITEIGETSFTALARWPSSEVAQARKLSDRIEALNSSDGIFLWTLHDFPAPDPLAVGQSFWIRQLQSHFGLYGLDGEPKPAAEFVRQALTDFLEGAQHVTTTAPRPDIGLPTRTPEPE